ncbi:DUF2935 domain-containing protein [Clostridium hydrogeniformans]|uniref:DUF2935 domain-containing protein n=1 Tax=Clostridium hydrogeniformans TaxID=349933 RepID=UPI000483155B|nr:DUF2935 domain-containing protein [Clostridium hydrogeniformans]
MLSRVDFIRQSLELHLFFARIMKEHSFFLEVGFVPADSNFILQADTFRKEFDKLLSEVISVSNGVVSSDVLESGEVVTPYTLKAEMASSYLTGVKIQTNLTQEEMNLKGHRVIMDDRILEDKVFAINDRSIRLITALIGFKTMLLSQVLACKVFTANYPLLIDHILREARLYLSIVKRLQKREEVDVEKESYEQEAFWDTIMAEHAKFIRGLLDPTEEALMKIANDFGNEFDKLTMEAKVAMEKTLPIGALTNETMKSTKAIRDFKEQGTKGLLECKIKSIIIPLLADHTLREANHYLRLLKIFEKR